MPDYKEMYFQLAAKVANAVDILVEAQQQGENDYTKEQTQVISQKILDPKSRVVIKYDDLQTTDGNIKLYFAYR